MSSRALAVVEVGFVSPSCGSRTSAGIARVAGAGDSPTRISNEATIMRSLFAAAWANCELYWKPPTEIGATRSDPSE